MLTAHQDQPFTRVPVILHGISSFDQDTLERVAVPIVKGLSRCVFDGNLLRNEITVSPDFWSILQRLHQHKDAAPLVFSLLKAIVDSNPPIVTADNYESAVALANEFISAGSVGYIEERHRDTLARRSKGVKQPKQRFAIKLPSLHLLLTQSISMLTRLYSENEVVSRGVTAIGLIYHLTGRAPTLIKQSHLEDGEGLYSVIIQ